MFVAPTKTEAETALAAQFKRVVAQLPGGEALVGERMRAFEAFEKIGLPHRRIEAWKYTDLRARLTSVGSIATGEDASATKAQLDVALGALASLDADRIVFVNGMFRAELSAPIAELEHGARVGRQVEAMDSGGDASLPAHLEKESIALLNAAMVTDGAVITVSETRGKPLLIVSAVTGSTPRFYSLRHRITTTKNVSATVLETCVALDGAKASQVNSVAEVCVHEGATLTHVVVGADEGQEATRLRTTSIDVETDASYRAFQLTASTGLTRNQSFVRFSGQHSKIDISGLMLGRGREHIDTTLVIDHAVPNCESRELFKAVLDDSARAVFQGKVIVRQDAQKTDGKQMANALMLSENCEFDSKPELEIYADDVVCGHGATVAEIDPAQLFYLRARGIPKEEAQAMLIESFAADALEKVEDEAIRSALQQIATDWFAKRKGGV